VLGVAGHELIVNHDQDQDVYAALRDAFASLARRLEDVGHRRGGTIRKHASVTGSKATPIAVDQD